VLALPIAGEIQRIGEVEHLLLFAAPTPVHKFIRRDSGAAQQLLHLVAGKLGLAIEDAQELPGDGLCDDWGRFRGLVGILIDQLVDADQSVLDRDRAAFVNVDLAIVAGEVFQRLAAPDDLQGGGGQTCAGMVFQIFVNEPSMIGIIGRSGAGKFTLLRMVNRLSDATSGTITYQSEDITSLRGAARRNWQSRCALIFQQFYLVPRMDVVSNVLHGTLKNLSTVATLFNLYPQICPKGADGR
jgi:ABC-type multidrug transport system fused ATPase/permease subunit